MNGFDAGIGALAAAGFFRGRKRGLGNEIYRSIMIGLPVVAGCGLFKMASGLLSALPGLNPENSGLAGFLVVIGGSYALLRAARRKLRAFLVSKFDTQATRTAAGVVGLVRYAIVAIGIVAAIDLSPASFLTKNSAIGSRIGPPAAEASSDAEE